jgi:hypothetical protein
MTKELGQNLGTAATLGIGLMVAIKYGRKKKSKRRDPDVSWPQAAYMRTFANLLRSASLLTITNGISKKAKRCGNSFFELPLEPLTPALLCAD